MSGHDQDDFSFLISVIALSIDFLVPFCSRLRGLKGFVFSLFQQWAKDGILELPARNIGFKFFSVSFLHTLVLPLSRSFGFFFFFFYTVT